MARLWIVPAPETTPRYIRGNPEFHPFFDGCIGALDGTYVPIWIPQKKQSPWRDRKKGISQNVLAICDFDMLFTGVFAGMEGSAPDSKVLNHVLCTGALCIPDGRFYLGDAGYGLSKFVLTPYRGQRYHLKEWGLSGERYSKEFNPHL